MPRTSRDKVCLIILAAICAAAFCIRAFHAGDSIGGFHSFNEGWYASLARNYQTHSLFFPTATFGTTDFNVPPFYSFVLYAVMSLFGDQIAAYRLTSICFSTVGIALLYFVGARLYGRRAALAAAALLAFCPVSIVAGRNIQTDPAYMCFLLGSILLFLKAAQDHRPQLLAWSGLLFGLAFFTKQFAVLWLPAAAIWAMRREGGLRAIGRPHLWFALCTLIAPGPFYLYHIFTGRLVALTAMFSQGQMVMPSVSEYKYIFIEMFWGLSPFVFALCVAGVAAAGFRRKAADRLLLLAVGFFFVFFSIWHGHSYYMYYSVPFLCLLGGRLIADNALKSFSPMVVLVLITLAALQSIAFLCSVKYAYSEFSSVADLLQGRNATLIIDNVVEGSYQPAVFYYCNSVSQLIPESHFVYDQKAQHMKKVATFPKGRPTFILSILERPEAQTPTRRMKVQRNVYVLVIFGRQVVIRLPGEHFFNISSIELPRVGPWTAFGVFKAGSADSMILSEPEPGSSAPVVGGKIIFNPGAKGAAGDRSAPAIVPVGD
jgi:uncharacterized membrane protein